MILQPLPQDPACWVTHQLSDGWRPGEGGERAGSSASEFLSQSPCQQWDTQIGFGLDPDLEHSEVSILLELQTNPFRGSHISAGFAVTSELFNFT